MRITASCPSKASTLFCTLYQTCFSSGALELRCKTVALSSKLTTITTKMNGLHFAVLLLAVSLFNPVLGITGSLAVEGGGIAIVLILVATFIAVGIGLGTCFYKNDLCTCGKAGDQA